MKLHYKLLVICCAFLFSSKINAQQCLDIGATPLQDATLNSDNEYIITPAQQNQVGAFWGVNTLDLNEGFDFEFRIFLGNDNAGADGVAFVLRGIGSSEFGNSGGGVGYESITPSFAVEFDTFTNSNQGDPNNGSDHTGIQIDGSADHSDSTTNLFGPQVIGTNGDIEDDTYHDVQFIWDPANNTFTYFFDGVLLTTINNDLRTILGASEVIWGFTGSTGGRFNEQKICALTQIGDPPPPPVDLDKDNDGITNADECGNSCAQPLSNGGFEAPTTNSFGFFQAFREGIDDFDTHELKWSTTSSDNNIELWRDGFSGVPAFEGNQFAELNATEVSTLYQNLCITPGSVVRWSVRHRGRTGVDVAEVQIGESLTNAVTQATMSDGNTDWGLYTGEYTVPADQQTTVFAFVSISSAGDQSSGNFIDDVQITVISAPACPDLDGDGIPNDEDLDSDGDGCSDALEAGYPDPSGTGHPDSLESTNVQEDADGLVSNSTTINANGGYLTPLDGDNNGVPDFLEANTLSFTTAPTDQVINEDESVSFSFETDDTNVTISWEESTDNGSTWTTLSDGGIYSGTTTNTLTINPVSLDFNGYLYRVTITTASGIACIQTLTAQVRLTVLFTIFVPDGFSPNGDGINDTLIINDLATFPNHTIKIYNRYGNKVFEGNINTPPWDGSSSSSFLSGKVVPSGVYFYVIELNQAGFDPIQGRIHLRK